MHRDPNRLKWVGCSVAPRTPDPKNAFWNDQARNLFLGLALYLLDTPSLPCTLGELLRQSSGKGMPLKEYLLGIMAKRSSGSNALSDECLDALNRFCSTSENTLSSILATFNAPLTIFAIPIVDAATSASDFDITAVRKELMTIYVGIQPGCLADAALLINLFFSQLINLNTKELPFNNPALKHQCLLLMDEAMAFGRIGILAKAVGYIAGYNLRLLTIMQNIGQMESTYGKEATRAMITSHGLQVAYPPRDQKDAVEYSEMLGYFTETSVSKGISRPRSGFFGSNNGSSSENTSFQRRALLLPQEVKELGQDKEIVFLENSKPILAEKARYYTDHNFMDRLKFISPSLRALGKKLPTKEQLEEAAFVRKELAIQIPKIDLDLHKAKTERRVREVNPNEPIDLSKLAVDVATLPTIDDPENPSEEQVADLVDAFFSQLDWVNKETGEIGTAPGAEDVIKLDNPVDELDKYFNEQGDPAHAQAVPMAASQPAKPKSGAIDLSVLDN